jgi:hypothetical protein
VENQVARTEAALRGLREDVFTVRPGGQTRSIREVGRHLFFLRSMQLKMLAPRQAGQMPPADAVASITDLRKALATAARLLTEAIGAYNPTDWRRKPRRRRPGPWGDQPTIVRFARPLNDFTSHLGDIRTIRSILGNPVGQKRENPG